jgi:hypothetical protein
MMTGPARSSVTIMGLDTHMILETLPVSGSPRRTAHHVINPAITPLYRGPAQLEPTIRSAR